MKVPYHYVVGPTVAGPYSPMTILGRPEDLKRLGFGLFGPPSPGLVQAVRAAARAALGPVKGWAASGFMSRKRERELDRRVARLGVVKLGRTSEDGATLDVGALRLTVHMGPGHDRLARWTARLIALAELGRDPAPELLALSAVLRVEGRVEFR